MICPINEELNDLNHPIVITEDDTADDALDGFSISTTKEHMSRRSFGIVERNIPFRNMNNHGAPLGHLYSQTSSAFPALNMSSAISLTSSTASPRPPSISSVHSISDNSIGYINHVPTAYSTPSSSPPPPPFPPQVTATSTIGYIHPNTIVTKSPSSYSGYSYKSQPVTLIHRC